MSSALSIQSVSKQFGGLKALDKVSFDVASGAFFGLIGANGAGKTTLFSLIAGHQPPTSGEIRLFGERIDGMPPWKLSRKGVARTFQIMRPFMGMTVEENIKLGFDYGAKRDASHRHPASGVDELLADLELDGLRHVLATDLTLAMQKRVEVARALATRPRVLLLDEVLSGLTPSEVVHASALMRRIHQKYGLTILMVEHVLKAVMELCEHVVVLHHGEKICDGSPTAVTSDPRVLAAYFGTKEAA
ncbi:MAG: transporter related [Burkholderia sp.]|jgi:branched-chain amino acid transport system ATP-binding protein|nr:transporter related [Burkholderia sp.]